MNPFQKSTLNRHLEYLISNLSVRAQNGLEKVSLSLNPKEIFEKIFSDTFQFKRIQNIGDGTVDELNKMKSKVSHFIEVLRTIENEQLSKEYAKLIVKTSFANLPIDFEQKLDTIFDSNGKIKLFSLIKLLLDSDQLLSTNEKRIFSLSYSDFNFEKETLESIGTELQLTRERVRQIKTRLEDNIKDHFLFITNFTANDLINYGIDDL